jgi:hypothetical protein
MQLAATWVPKVVLMVAVRLLVGMRPPFLQKNDMQCMHAAQSIITCLAGVSLQAMRNSI